MHPWTRPGWSLWFACCCLLVLAVPAAAEPAKQIVFAGLRPLKQENGAGDLVKLGEAQQIRAIVEGVLTQTSGQAVLGHDDLKRQLGNDYVVRWFNCGGKLECIATVLAPLRKAGYRNVVTGEYFVAEGTYHFHIFTFSIDDRKLGKEVVVDLPQDQTKDPEQWKAKLAPLVEVPSGHVHLVSNVGDSKCLLDSKPCPFESDGQTMSVPIGEHTIELSKEGYKNEKVVVSMQPQSPTQELAVALKPLAHERQGGGAGSGAGSGEALSNKGPTLTAIRTDKAPVIDGKIDDSVWEKAWLEASFTQNFPDENKPPTQRTEMRVLYDDTAVYVAVRCFDKEPSKIVNRLTRRDRDVEADKVTVDISSKNDHASAFHFEVNSAGRQLDGTRFNDTDFNTDWDGLWYSAVTQDDKGWSAELAIPLVALRYAGDTTSFGFQVRRYIARRKEVDEWSYVPRDAQGEVSRYGELDALTGLNAKRLLTIAPYDERRLIYRTQQGSIDGTQFEDSIGADLKLGLTSALTLDATINPDFGTVEVDQVVLNLSTVEQFFPEKRPFFIEGADLFATPFQMFYSRRVGKTPPGSGVNGTEIVVPPKGHILGAVKTTGLLANRLSIGVLDALTSSEDTVIQRSPSDPYETVLVEPQANYAALRLRQEFGVNSSIGLLGTGVTRFEPLGLAAPRPGDGCARPHGGLTGSPTPVDGRCTSDAYVGGVDGVFKTDDGEWGGSGQVVTSVLEHGPPRLIPDGTLIKPGDLGFGIQGEAGKYGGEHWLFKTKYSYMSPKLELNDAGFLGAANDQTIYSTLTLRTKKPVWKLQDGSLGLTAWYENFPDTHAPTARWVFLTWAGTLPNFWSVGGNFGAYLPYYDHRETRDGAMLDNRAGFTYGLNLGTNPAEPIVASLSTGGQTQLRGVDNASNLTINLHPASFIEFDVISDLTYSFGVPRYVADETDMATGLKTYYLEDLRAASFDVLLRGTWTFSPSISLQAYAQVYLDSGHYGRVTSVVGSGAHAKLDISNFMSATAPAGIDDDFSDSAVNVNAFLRWEFRPGSALWFVYTRNQNNLPYDSTVDGPGSFRYNKFGGPSTDVLLVKLSYLWSPFQ